MTIRIALLSLAALAVAASSALAQDQTDDVQQGHRLAVLVCSACHVAARDQDFQPILQPPAPSFESIAQRSNISAESLRTFLSTTHRGIDSPKGMPNPELLDSQIRQVAAYILSLRKQGAAGQGSLCRAEIVRLEGKLSQARANREDVASAPESAAARLHRQPTPESVQQAENEAVKNVEAAFALARQLDSEGKDAECLATLRKIALFLGER